MSTINVKDFTALSLLFFLFVLTEIVQAEEIVTPEVMVDSVDQGMVPPAPPGPYVSTGLRDISSKASPVVSSPSVDNVATRPAVKPEVRVDSTDVPMEAYSPDRPWPKNLRPRSSQPSAGWAPDHGMPAYGNRQTNPAASQKTHRAPSYNAPATGGYMRNPGLPYMNNQRMQRMPSMGVGSQGANAYMPNFGSPGYQMPNRFAPQNNYPSGYPMNRAPYPSNYQQGYPN